MTDDTEDQDLEDLAELEDKEVVFILSISDYGLEYRNDVTSILSTEAMHESLANQLAGIRDTKASNLHMVIESQSMRARMNCHRNYEVYTLKTQASVAYLLIKALKENNEKVKELVRKKGVKIA